MHLFLLPREIIHMIDVIMGHFFWVGPNFNTKIHLVRWSDVAQPVVEGGWGLINTSSFKKPLIIKKKLEGSVREWLMVSHHKR